MNDLIELTGFLAAHAIWSVSSPESGDLIPMVGYGDKQMERWVGVENPQTHFSEKWLPAHPEVSGAVCAYDGFLTLSTLARTDTIYVDTVDRAKALHLTMAIPYRPARNPGGFAVFRPKVISHEGVLQGDLNSLLDHFWAGVDSHEQAAAVWNAALDQSM